METTRVTIIGTEPSHRRQAQWLEDIFSVDEGRTPATSSGRKQVLYGSYSDRAGNHVPACALVYRTDEVVTFGKECANLGTCSLIGVGPRLLEVAHLRVGADPGRRPIIIEEDVGTSLSDLLGKGRGIPTTDVLHPVGTQERDIENAKVAFDMMSQVMNAHGEGLYHRDLRCQNVCVRRFGTGPADIRATVIDVELGAGLGSGKPRFTSHLYDTLFDLVPGHMLRTHAGPSAGPRIVPTPLELDLGYLAAALFHMARGATVLDRVQPDPSDMDDFLSFTQERTPFFGYVPETCEIRARRLDPKVDLAPLAEGLSLTRVDDEAFPTPDLLRQAQSYRRLYLDGEHMNDYRNSSAYRMSTCIDELVRMKFERYKERRRLQGKKVEYERIEDQPQDLRSSNYDQMAHLLTKVVALGYETADLATCDPADRVTALSDDQVETLARMEHARWVDERLSKGWTLGERDHAAKTSPYLIPYDELSEDMRDYDRDVARSAIPLLERAGIAIVRPS